MFCYAYMWSLYAKSQLSSFKTIRGDRGGKQRVNTPTPICACSKFKCNQITLHPLHKRKIKRKLITKIGPLDGGFDVDDKDSKGPTSFFSVI